MKVVEIAALRNKIHIFKNRLHAGMRLADELKQHVERDAVLLALPSGGVPVGYAVSKSLRLPLDVVVVRKIQIPWNTEAGFGAISWDGSLILNDSLVKELGLTPSQIEESIAHTKKILSKRTRKFRGNRPAPQMQSRTVILVDDGLASGYTMTTAVDSVRRHEPQKIIVAVPTGSRGAVRLVSSKANLTVCLNIREGPFFAVADAYEDWHDLTDDEVVQYLDRAHSEVSSVE